MRLLNNALQRLPFQAATATITPHDGDGPADWAAHFRAASRVFRRFARTLERVADLCDQADGP